MKTCTLCNKTLELESFSKKSSYHDGLSPWCKPCTSAKNKADYKLKKDHILAKSSEYYYENKDAVLQRRKNDPAIKEYNKQWNESNKEHVKEYNKQYKSENAEQIRQRRKQYRLEHREEIREYEKDKLKTDPLFKLGKMLRARLTDFIKNSNQYNKKKTAEYIGCSMEEVKAHIEKQFTPEMTWENHAEVWQIDHIIPLTSAKTEEQLYSLCRWSNLRPLLNAVHFVKQTKLDGGVCFQKAQRDRFLVEDIKNGFPLDAKAKEFDLAYEPIGDEHREFIKRYEWVGTCGFSVRHVFTARYKGMLGGVVMTGEPTAYQFNRDLEALIQRGACASWTPKNLGSRLVMFACRWLLNNTSKRIFTAYSDPEAGEIGTIYQACNFDYLGQYYGADFFYKLSNGKLTSARFFTRTSSMKKWAKELGIKWLPEWNKANGFQKIDAIPDDIWQQLCDHARLKRDACSKVKKAPKGKYALLLLKKGENIEKTWKSEPYPKRKV